MARRVIVYEDLERAERKPRRVVDHSEKWAMFTPVADVNGANAERLLVFCGKKRITIDALAALGTRVVTRRNGLVELAFAGTNGNGAVTAIKYRPVDGSSHDSTAEAPSMWLRPIVAGKLDSPDWLIVEGETDAARLYGLVGDRAAIVVLPAGARAFRREWAALIPRGATVALCHDADTDGDNGALKAAAVLGGRTIRLRPPVEGGDWCDWTGDRDAFLELIRAAKPSGKITATPLSGVEMRSIEWLEKPLWQSSAFQLLAGPKGAGKGTYLASLAARVSRSANVLFLASEDSAAIDLKPRLVAAGANIDNCSLIEQTVRLPDSIDDLRDLALELGDVKLLVLDPVANHIGDSNSNQEAEVRHAIAPLNRLADELGCLLIGVRHPGKDRSRGAVASILGSTAWVDVPRAVVMIAIDDEDELLRHIQVVAGNRSLNGSAQAFRIEAVPVADLAEPITRAIDLGASSKSVDELLAAPKAETAGRVPAADVQAVILEALATGEKTRNYLDETCRDELGVNPDTVYKSGLAPLRKDELIHARKAGSSGRWYWQLNSENARSNSDNEQAQT